MDAAALENAINSLEIYWGSLDNWLRFWIALVVLGVIVELVVIIVDYRLEYREYLRGTIRSPAMPSGWLLFCGLLGAGLVAIGVAGEFAIHISASKVESDMRRFGQQLSDVLNTGVTVAQKEAAEARERTAQLEKEAAQLRKDAERDRLARVKVELELTRIKTPRELTVDRPVMDKLRQFKGTPFIVGVAQDAESNHLATGVVNALTSAGWLRQTIAGDVLLMDLGIFVPSTPITGIRITAGSNGQQAACMALFEMLRAAGIEDTMGLVGNTDHVPLEQQKPIAIMIGEKPKTGFKDAWKGRKK